MRAPIALGLLLAASAASAEDSPICADRPAKANAVCTVPAGRVQVESSLGGWVHNEAAGTETDSIYGGASVFKLGLSDRSDLQLGVTPYVRIETRGREGRSAIAGIGDVIIRYKHRLTASDAPVEMAIIPFVKLPTAKRGIGNRKVEGGVAVPLSFALVGPVTATLGPELDLLADADGRGRHVALVNLANLSATVVPRLTVAAELWTNLNFDPEGTVRQASADVAAAYAVTGNLQLDAGANFGLNRDTPDTELYLGTSIRF